MPNIVLKGHIFTGSEFLEEGQVVVDQDKGIISDLAVLDSDIGGRNSNVISIPDTTILPGLIDAHVHFFGSIGISKLEWATTPGRLVALRSVADLRNLLRAGFTTVRDLGSKVGTFLNQAIREGAIEGPRVVSCGRALTQTGGDDDVAFLPLAISEILGSYSYFCDGPWNCRRAVRKVIRIGGEVIKVYASGNAPITGRTLTQYTVEELKTIVHEAHSVGLKVTAHAIGSTAMSNCVEAKVDSIEHGFGLTHEVAAAIQKAGIHYVPTFSPIFALRRDSGSSPEKEFDQLMTKHLSEDVSLAKQYSLKLVNGSDFVGGQVMPHGEEYKELTYMAKFFGNENALIAATSAAAECLGIRSIGRIEKGLEADLIVVKGNPMKDIDALAPKNVLHVIKGGKLNSERYSQ